MATLQKRKSRGKTYWSIVESRRVNGKPRPVILAYLGRAEDLVKRLTEGIPQKAKSYSHGHVAMLLHTAEQLQVVETINRHLPEHRKQLRDGFTVGGSLLMAAIGRACRPTSKENWHQGFARYTSLAYLSRMSLSKLDSQHFWDQMEALPPSAIPLIEEDLIRTMVEKNNLTLDTLLCDTTNFFTYIASTNERCSLAQRGKNKQKRMDLRQLGLLLLITRQDDIPLFHKVYEGNLQDRTVFKKYFQDMVDRFKAIAGSLEDITIVFDQGNNSKKTLKEVDSATFFVGALSPYHHRALIEKANQSMRRISIGGRDLKCYRTRTLIWDLDLSSVVYISEKLRQGQIRGIEQNIAKLSAKLDELKEKIRMPTRRGPKRNQEDLEKKIKSMISSFRLDDLIHWTLGPLSTDTFDLKFWINEDQFNTLKENWFGRRILITNRHNWSTEQIISAYWGQARVEYAFKNLKNPFHLALRPQYHWTDQKIKVHAFICVIAFLLSMVIYKQARENAAFTGTPHNLFEKLSNIRLATFIESPSKKTKGRYKATHRIEEMDEDIYAIAHGLGLTDNKLKTNIPFSVYK
ncbi:MAG: IS1634 family transposase [Deltaproteobacteria bacterium]|nr:IS1634 family transposase [Deltaproteobacteria bacterium]MBW1816936.1 IS1634 family transposase [Deltaproteobacteria bacterium]